MHVFMLMVTIFLPIVWYVKYVIQRPVCSKTTDGYVVESGGVRGYPLQRMITVGANVTF
mgnify:CR=1 FL=1